VRSIERLLEVKGLTKYFGGLAAVSELDFDVYRGEILGLIGPNGAGKTTVFNLISGFFRPNKGKIMFKGLDITGLKPHKIAALGLVRTFQKTLLFGDQTVSKNISIGLHGENGNRFSIPIFNSRSDGKKTERLEQRVIEVLERMELVEVKDELARNLPYGLQRRLGVALALATNPELTLLDEPATGMTETETSDIMDRFRDIREQGVTILLVEHNMKAVMNTCDRIIVLNFGRKLAEGTPDNIKENRDVIESYLGSEED